MHLTQNTNYRRNHPGNLRTTQSCLHSLRKHTARNGEHHHGGKREKPIWSQRRGPARKELIEKAFSGQSVPTVICGAIFIASNTLNMISLELITLLQGLKKELPHMQWTHQHCAASQPGSNIQRCQVSGVKSATKILRTSAAGTQQGNYIFLVPLTSSKTSASWDNKGTRLKHSTLQIRSYFNVVLPLFSDESNTCHIKKPF